MALVRSLDEFAHEPEPDFDRFAKALWRDGKPDRVPFYELFANQGIQERILGKKIEGPADSIEFYYRMGYDYAPTGVGIPMACGDLIDTSKGYPIRDWQSFEEYHWPDVSDLTYDMFEAVGARLPDGMKMVGQTGGILETLEGLCGYAGLCVLLCDDRELVAAVAERVGVLWEAAYRGMASIENVGAVVISDDLGFKTQTLISPTDLREFVLPWHKRLAQAIHDHGKPCILHSCGNLEAIMDDLIEDVGIDAKHSYEDAILPATEAKRRYGDRVAILGGFDLDLLCRSAEEGIRAHTRRLMETCGASGGYAFGSGNSIADYVPIENYLTMMDEAWKIRGAI
jgi:uroporphyrinogen decarboxylase